MLRLLQYYRPYQRLLVYAVICNLLMSVFMVISIPVLQPFLQILFGQGGAPAPDTGKSDSGFAGIEQQTSAFFSNLIAEHGREQALLIVCIFLVIIFLGKNLFRYLSLYFLAPVRNGIVRDIRQRLVDKMLALPLSYYSEERKGDLMSRISADVQEIEWSIVGVVESVAREPIVIVGSIAFMIWVSPSLLLFVFGLMLFSGLIIATVGRSLRRQSGQAQSLLGTLGSLIEETLGGLRIIKGFNAEAWQSSRYAAENNNYARTMTRLYRRKDLASPLSEFLGIGAVSVLLWFGAKQVFAGEITAATFITFLYAFYNVIEPSKALSGAMYSIRKGMGAVERVEAVLQAPLGISDAPDAQPKPGFETSVEFRNITFRYPGAERDALQNISLHIPKGKVVALVGASGAGKSTVADLLPRFYEPDSGEILIDGQNIQSLRLRDLRALLGIVSQEAILFNDTVAANIAFGVEKVLEDGIVPAAKAANAHEFIVQMPQGYRQTQRRSAPTPDHRPGPAQKSAYPDSRRSHLRPGFRIGTTRTSRPRTPAEKPHRPGHRPPPEHRSTCRRNYRARSGPHRGARYP
jgi:ABC-type multidrug transport system fused ATPase/permease subunit